MATFKGHGLSVWSAIKDIFIITIGIVGFLFGTYTSIIAIIKGFEVSADIVPGSSTITNTTAFHNSSSAQLRTCKYPY